MVNDDRDDRQALKEANLAIRPGVSRSFFTGLRNVAIFNFFILLLIMLAVEICR